MAINLGDATDQIVFVGTTGADALAIGTKGVSFNSDTDVDVTLTPMPNAKMVDATKAIVTWPVDVWFGGSRTFQATLDFGGRSITAVKLDPRGRFPDRDPSDNVWPKAAGTR